MLETLRGAGGAADAAAADRLRGATRGGGGRGRLAGRLRPALELAG